jgi:hypothetical protein
LLIIWLFSGKQSGRGEDHRPRRKETSRSGNHDVVYTTASQPLATMVAKGPHFAKFLAPVIRSVLSAR